MRRARFGEFWMFCERFHCNAMKTSIKVRMNWHKIQQIEYTYKNVYVLVLTTVWVRVPHSLLSASARLTVSVVVVVR